MQPIFDRYGELRGWLDVDCVRNRTGSVIAFVSGRNDVYAPDGSHLGRFSSGYFWDHSGGAVAWTKSARGVPPTPLAAATEDPPPREPAPFRPVVREIPPRSVMATSYWSAMSWLQFLACRGGESRSASAV
jgi:hypothetical protein